MNKIKSIAIDDEPLALRQLKSYITRTPSLELLATFSNALEALEFLKRETVDLIFVDINMPDLNGLDFVRSLKEKRLIIFTTAYSEHAVEGFRLDAVDYLLKPFSYEEFQRAAAKAQSLYELLQLARNTPADTDPEEKPLSEALPEGREYISIKADYKTSLVKISDIVYIESEGEYVRLHLNDGSSIMTLFRLKNMQTVLPAEHFLRIHRSYIINVNYITSYAKGRVFLGEHEYIPIGENYRPVFQKYIDEHYQIIG